MLSNSFILLPIDYQKTRMLKKYTFLVSSLLFATISRGHSGRTDSQGGHRDNISGGYHFHHGESAHQHINGQCPYDSPFFDSNLVLGLIVVYIIGLIMIFKIGTEIEFVKTNPKLTLLLWSIIYYFIFLKSI